MSAAADELRRAIEAVPVAGLDALFVRVPFRRPFLTAIGMWLHREAWIVRLRAPDGRVGLGEAVLEPGAREVAETVLRRLVRDAAERARAGDVPSAEELALHGAPGRALAAALDAARLDLGAGAAIAAAATGATDGGMAVNGTISFGGPNAGAEAALQAIEAGFVTLKLKAGAERETADLVARVRAVRAAVGPDIRLRLDANGAWDLPTAEERLDAVARFDLEYVEQPLPPDDVDAMAELRREVDVRLAVDETVESPRAARAVLAAGAADVLVVKPARVGGPAGVLEIAALAATAGVPVVVSTLFETGVGVAAALAAARLLPAVVTGPFAGRELAHGLATAGLLEHDLLEGPLVVEHGRIRVPGDGSGSLGIALDAAAVARFATELVEATP